MILDVVRSVHWMLLGNSSHSTTKKTKQMSQQQSDTKTGVPNE